jgi:hypothetical protein
MQVTNNNVSYETESPKILNQHKSTGSVYMSNGQLVIYDVKGEPLEVVQNGNAGGFTIYDENGTPRVVMGNY